MTFVEEEIASQPDSWQRAAAVGTETASLGAAGERIALIGCGTSWFVGQAAASWRETAGLGETDAFTASEMPTGRQYDRIIALTRSGTTSEVLEVLRRVNGDVATTVVLGDLDTPAPDLADEAIDLSFADERSVVQTRFATSALMLFRAAWRGDTGGLADAAAAAVAAPLEPAWAAAEQSTFLGRAWTVGLAHEAALKFRETSSSWAESYPAMDYRHGPISIAAPGRTVWMLGDPPSGLADDVTATGASWISDDRDPMVQLVTVQRVAVARALALGLDPDAPRNLSRSVVLPS
ncbi:MAG: SIS domain-containing protein [Microlunatus sp.]|nr:SIS domain-containing protein [Microlunatus sp.]MDN5771563.1 SIS domain-containing protein [Microlunatus sp.]MDN5804019.1 SIS domain-containing protein [Microlunatus sp.]